MSGVCDLNLCHYRFHYLIKMFTHCAFLLFIHHKHRNTKYSFFFSLYSTGHNFIIHNFTQIIESIIPMIICIRIILKKHHHHFFCPPNSWWTNTMEKLSFSASFLRLHWASNNISVTSSKLEGLRENVCVQCHILTCSRCKSCIWF